ncbi:Hypothetical predicted protein [Lecanosticta acicola]|uniref:ASST-domain-containing protein n=1 Tax=Lecanosticta acicola TaxID=111012 RepID=A0AAI9E9A7_9PEZI|nr:Hypothetical predicted protein [Lecanosticta acicola]
MALLSRIGFLLSFSLCSQAVAGPASETRLASSANVQVETDPDGDLWPWRTFKSSPHTPPTLTYTADGKPLSDGHIFITPADIKNQNATKQSAGFTITTEGEPVYVANVSGMTDFRKQDWNGDPYLTYWSGYNTNGANTGHGYGQVTFTDDEYKTFDFDPDLHLNKLVNDSIANGSVDIHEHQITSRNTILISAYNNTQMDLTSVNGSADAWIVDALFYEVDIKTEEVLFQWKAVDHLPLTASKQPVVSVSGNGTKAAPWDWFHINAVQLVGEDYLISSRHLWTVFLISGKDGSIVWSLEGENGGSFGQLPDNGTFRWQHYARAHNVTQTSLDLSMFDNHNQVLDNGTMPTRMLVYHLDLPPSEGSSPLLTRRIEVPTHELYADSQGSYTADLPNGNQFVGYGQLAILREFGPGADGSDLRWEAQFGALNKVQSYRAFKQTWSATPAGWDPSLVVEDGKAYVSWNGATEVEEWTVYVGNDEEMLECAGVARKMGFETTFVVPGNGSLLQVGARQCGNEVRRSNIVRLK